jgi:hypothetical protein
MRTDTWPCLSSRSAGPEGRLEDRLVVTAWGVDPGGRRQVEAVRTYLESMVALGRVGIVSVHVDDVAAP